MSEKPLPDPDEAFINGLSGIAVAGMWSAIAGFTAAAAQAAADYRAAVDRAERAKRDIDEADAMMRGLAEVIAWNRIYGGVCGPRRWRRDDQRPDRVKFKLAPRGVNKVSYW